MKNTNDVTRYIIPIGLWSVVPSSWSSIDPRVVVRTGAGRLTIGEGAVTVTAGLQRVDSTAGPGGLGSEASAE